MTKDNKSSLLEKHNLLSESQITLENIIFTNYIHSFKNLYNENTNYHEIKDLVIMKPLKQCEGLIYFDEYSSSIDKQFIKEVLNKHFLFKSSSEEIVFTLIDKFLKVKINEGFTLFKEGEQGNFFYIIYKGIIEIQLSCKSKQSKTISAGCSFGEQALLQKAKRSASALANTDVVLFYCEGKVFRKIINEINKSESKERLFFISLIPLFKGLSEMILLKLSYEMIKLTNNQGDRIISKDNLSESLFILKNGELGVEINDQLVRYIKAKEYFGEMSLIFDIKSTSSIVVLSEQSISYLLPRESLKKCVGMDYKHYILKCLLKNAFELSNNLKFFLIDQYFNSIYETFETKIYYSGDIVLESSKMSNQIIVTAIGQIYCKETEEIVLERGKIFGDEYIVTNKERTNLNLVCLTDSIVLISDWEKISKVINPDKSVLESFCFLQKYYLLRQIEIFSSFSNNKIWGLCEKISEEVYKKDEFVFKTGSFPEKLYIINQGSVRVERNNKYVRSLDIGQCFGELSILLNKEHTADIIVDSNILHLYILKKKDFLNIITKQMHATLLYSISLLDTFKLRLENLYYYKTLGEGKFGKVLLVHNGSNVYAAKVVNKSLLYKQKVLINYFINEKKVLLSMNHPFIVKLVKTMRSDMYLFYIQEYISGLVFSKYLYNRKEKEIYNLTSFKFYMSNILIALDYIHSKKICHRDLKPDNIMIDNKGYLKILDFGTSIFLKDQTFTITGTPHYIAPEIVNGNGYSFSCDYWSIGIIAYEIFFNVYPFGNKAVDPIEIYKEVLSIRPKYELKNYSRVDNKTIEDVVNFIESLLQKNPYKRESQLKNIKEMDIFSDFEFESMIEFQIQPEFIPNDKISFDMIISSKDSLLLNYINKIGNTLIKNGQKNLSSIYSSESLNVSYDENWEENF